MHDYLGQTTEHSSHRLEVQPLGAVHYDNIHAQCLPQVLGGLRLPRACRPLGAASSMKMKGSSKSHVATVNDGYSLYVSTMCLESV